MLSYLDPKSLVKAETVSRSWNKAAACHHVWRNVFRQEYGSHAPKSPTMTKKSQSAGLGKTKPNQDWKKMTLVRSALDRRWKEGKAAAIYLQGHTDSVYCVQFDEYVPHHGSILTVILIVFIDTKSSPVLETALFASGMLIIPGHVSRSSARLLHSSADPQLLMSTLSLWATRHSSPFALQARPGRMSSTVPSNRPNATMHPSFVFSSMTKSWLLDPLISPASFGM